MWNYDKTKDYICYRPLGKLCPEVCREYKEWYALPNKSSGIETGNVYTDDDIADANMQYKLGNRFYHGLGVDLDYKQAVYWYEKAANQGNIDAQFNLGVCYDNGSGVSQDSEKAVYWYKKAAGQGNAAAQYNLGVLYEKGQGMLKNKEKAIEWYEKAASLGEADAVRALKRLKKRRLFHIAHSLKLDINKDNNENISGLNDWEEKIMRYIKDIKSED